MINDATNPDLCDLTKSKKFYKILILLELSQSIQ